MNPRAADRVRALVTGSPHWRYPDKVTTALADLRAEHGDRLTVLHGACPTGVDAITDQWCQRAAVAVQRYPAHWPIGRHAGHLRNATMVGTGPHRCVVFIRARSVEATDCAQLAAAAGIPTAAHHDYDTQSADIAAAVRAVRPGWRACAAGCGWPLDPANGDHDRHACCHTYQGTTAPPPQRKPTMALRTDLQEALLRNALDAAERGWHVFPLRPDDKRPAVRDWETRATTDLDRIARCWTTGPYNVGIACGPSGLVVVDLDTPKPGQSAPPAWDIEGVNDGGEVLAVLFERAGATFPNDTYTVTTGRGGTHLYFRHPVDGPQLRNTAGALGWLVDTRAHGGYVVAAGSSVAGRSYTVLHHTDPALLPEWLANRLRPAPPLPHEPVVVDLPAGRAGAYVRAAIDKQLAHLTATPEGWRNQTLYLSAIALGQLVAGGLLPEADAVAVLLEAALSVGLTHREAVRTIASGLTAGARRPRGVAA